MANFPECVNRSMYAEMLLDEMFSFTERLRCLVERDGDFLSPTQQGRVEVALAYLNEALHTDYIENTGYPIGEPDVGTPEYAARMWVDGEFYSLRHELRDVSLEVREDVEFRAARRLVVNEPRESWLPHQRALFERVVHRKQRELMFTEVMGMPPEVGVQFHMFGMFREGDLSVDGFVHERTSREKVRVSFGGDDDDIIGYVCSEEWYHATVIDDMGYRHRVLKARIRVLPEARRAPLTVEHELAQLLGRPY